MLDIKDQEIAATRRALEDMTKVADRSIELANVSKPNSNWELQGILGLALSSWGLLPESESFHRHNPQCASPRSVHE